MDVATRFRRYMFLERKRQDGLSPYELEQWTRLKRLLAQDFSPGVSDRHADDRESLRIPTRLAVSFASQGALEESLMTNLSRGGLFIVTEHLVEIGTRLVLRVRIDETGEEIELPAEVASHNLGARVAPLARGMGMRFRDLPPEAQKRMDDLYERAGLTAARSDPD